MLVKVWDELFWNKTSYANDYTSDWYPFTKWVDSLSSKKYCRMIGTGSCSSSSCYVYFKFWSSTTTVTYSSGHKNVDFEWRLDAWSIFKCYSDSSTGTWRKVSHLTMWAADYYLRKESTISWSPKDIEVIWKIGMITTFWLLSNWEREFWPIWKKEVSDSAVAWGITPPNYAWYLTIKASNWRIYKVWIYNP